MAASLRLVMVLELSPPSFINGLISFTGDIVYLELPGVSIVVLNSYEVAQELLGKRPNTTSGRKIGYMIREL
jgi:hypothetical protein